MTVAHRAIEGAGIPVIPIEDLIAGHDPYLNEAYARGMQAYHEGRYNDAHMLLDVCINAQPHPLKIEIDHFATLAEAFDARAVLLGEALLSDPSQRLAIGDKARVLEKLAILYGYLDQ